APLLGDGKGRCRVHLIGNSGKFGLLTTSLAACLVSRLSRWDELYWQPGRKESTLEEFEAQIRQKPDQDDRGWIIHGDYRKKMGDMVVSKSTDLI
ncbi:hypothetical protein L208DRAFT_1199746, partial [Tricholoma matsutake]